MKILITTGIYPPKIGGPAQYAKNLKDELEKIGHQVTVKTYNMEDKLPTGVRHIFFFLKIILTVLKSEKVFILDTFSVGLPTVLACKILGKKSLIRTGGDFLWEQYVERTGKRVLLRNFYETEKLNFSTKEKIIFKLTKWTLDNTDKIIFSTDWQRQIFAKAYNMDLEKTFIVENYYGPKESDFGFENKTFVASARNLVWKNLDVLKNIFAEETIKNSGASLFIDNLPYGSFMEKMKKCYAVILVSLGDISPNMILDAIRLNRPFVATQEIGIFERIKEVGIFVDPLNENEIKSAILNLLKEEGYREAKEKVRKFNFVHTWNQIAGEFLEIAGPIEAKLSFINLIKNIFQTFIYVRYFICGVTAAALNIFSLYAFTDWLHVWYIYSSIIAFLISVLVSFFLQKFVVFKDKNTNGIHKQFWKFVTVIILGTITNTFFVYLFTDIFRIWYILSQIIAGVFVMVQNFLFYKFVIFKAKEK